MTIIIANKRFKPDSFQSLDLLNVRLDVILELGKYFLLRNTIRHLVFTLVRSDFRNRKVAVRTCFMPCCFIGFSFLSSECVR